MDKVRIARELVRLARMLVEEEFSFTGTKECGPDHLIEVAKSDVFAHRLTADDVEEIRAMESREGKYDESYKTPGNWLCTAMVGEDAGEFWIVKDEKFGRNYDLEEGDAIRKTVCGMELEFRRHLAKGGAVFQCFRLPADAPAEMELDGHRFVPGDWVFVENGKCDVWARSASFMQQQYHKVGDAGNPPAEVYEQYEQMTSGAASGKQ